MSFILSCWKNTKTMPMLLRVICQGAMVAPPILAALLVLPLSEWSINGRLVSYSELWQSGAGMVLLASMFFATAGAWGSAARAPWARWALVATPVVPIVLAAIHPSTWFTEQATSEASTWVGAVATSAAIFAGLFLVPSVRAYFHPRNADA